MSVVSASKITRIDKQDTLRPSAVGPNADRREDVHRGAMKREQREEESERATVGATALRSTSSRGARALRFLREPEVARRPAPRCAEEHTRIDTLYGGSPEASSAAAVGGARTILGDFWQFDVISKSRFRVFSRGESEF